MPRYPMTTFLNKVQIEVVDKACKKKGLSRYKLMREAVLEYSKACLKEEEKENERESTKTGELEGRDEANHKGGDREEQKDLPPFL